MSDNLYIHDTALPLNRDFKALKNEALAFIQEAVGYSWTNFNPGDPGITILDQLCYALTELGYCNDFDIKDILTDSKGNLEIKDQFFLPEEILTTAPVTVTDYRKYLIDGVSGVNNAIIIPLPVNEMFFARTYKVYLYISSKDMLLRNEICTAAFFYLNQSRNLAELFMMPEPLNKLEFNLSGNIEIDKDADQYAVLQQIEDKINDYIFPGVVPEGYYSLSQDDSKENDIMNGPLLKNGYISADALGTKKDLIRAIDAAQLIKSIPGVIAVSKLSFKIRIVEGLPEIHCAPEEILMLNATQSIINKAGLTITKRGHELIFLQNETGFTLPSGNTASDISMIYGKECNGYSTLPKGMFRDINNYYSIQNTFPAAYATGASGTAVNASSYQVAQSRQLKGYLTLIDQVLANQFSQLANINRLFSFKNSLTGAPSDFIQLMDLLSPYERANPTVPVPYMVFSPTYFYQSLYGIPHIKPLLKNNDAFRFSYESEPDKEADHNAWEAYKKDPYNAYMSGLMRLMQDSDADLERRNNMLDHLLARHGESPLIIDSYICDAVYTGNIIKDKIIIKSLYLQNYGMLSYSRMKAFDFRGADIVPGLTPDLLQPRPEGFDADEENAIPENTIDFIFNSGRANETEKVTVKDAENYSAIELKLSMLFALRARYTDYSAGLIEKKRMNILIGDELKTLNWLIKYRSGCIMIETALLWYSLKRVITITADPIWGPWYTVYTTNEEYPDYVSASLIMEMLNKESKQRFESLLFCKSFFVNNTPYQLIESFISPVSAAASSSLNDSGYHITMHAENGITNKDFSLFDTDLIFIFPDLIPPPPHSQVRPSIDLFLKTELPVSTTYHTFYLREYLMSGPIDLFAAWRNSMRFHDPSTYNAREEISPAVMLINFLNQMYNAPSR